METRLQSLDEFQNSHCSKYQLLIDDNTCLEKPLLSGVPIGGKRFLSLEVAMGAQRDGQSSGCSPGRGVNE